MPITTHAVLQDDPLNHAAYVEYKPPCVAGIVSPSGTFNWTWTVQFVDADHDGRAELLMVSATHRSAPHAGESPNNFVGLIYYVNPCRITRVTHTIVLHAHATHRDQMATIVRPLGLLWIIRRRLYIILKHSGGDAV